MNTETTCVEKQPLTDAYLEKMNAYWRAANYLSAAQLYLLDNPLLREPLKPEHIKKKIVGHWGTVPGQNFVYCHMNRAIKKYDLDMVLISGPGHGGNFFVSNSYLEGTYSEVYPNVSEDMDGLKKLCKQFSFPGGISSHVAPETPGSINEGGELGYSIAHAFGSVFDNPDLITTCIVGDGEAETGPLATAWHSNKFLNPVTDGAVLPILHLNGYKISNPTIFSRISHDEIESFFHGCGWKPYFVEGDDPMTMHRKMAETVDTVIEEIHQIQEKLKKQNSQMEIGQTAYHREASRLESLRNIAERYEGYGTSIRRVMEQKDRQPGIHGVVADLIKVEKAYETAVETALGGSIQNIVTDNEQTAKVMIEYLKKNRYGRATFLPLTNMRSSSFQNPAALKEEGVIGLADTLVTAESTYRTLLSQLLGRTLVVDTIDHAIVIA